MMGRGGPPDLSREISPQRLVRQAARQMLRNFHHSFKTRIAVLGYRFIQTLARNTGFLGKFRV
jgi:hypothetical protein